MALLKAWSARPIEANSTIACVLGNGAERDFRQLSIAFSKSRSSSAAQEQAYCRGYCPAAEKCLENRGLGLPFCAVEVEDHLTDVYDGRGKGSLWLNSAKPGIGAALVLFDARPYGPGDGARLCGNCAADAHEGEDRRAAAASREMTHWANATRHRQYLGARQLQDTEMLVSAQDHEANRFLGLFVQALDDGPFSLGPLN